ncbi:hypothetical protein QSJ18_04665 [Gordonia sp. ABSL1-1]|uniref:hypothetical protein n=1 Tax=Gordonia sp. ABSL1-1 TaxID=3053923 RepID=UPI00257397E1|nr:hypothetical protein [Gordonia sp. ABSL1-1]MDL9936028.1 hypothetical protein [Gordonia sp. ABSL1-1]
MPKAQVLAIISENLDAVDPGSASVPQDTAKVQEYGCDTAFPSALPQGPPWWYKVQRRHSGVTDEQIQQRRDAVLTLAGRGFEVLARPASRNGDDPRDVVLRDSRGFQVSMSVSPSPDGSVTQVEITSSSPCVRHSGEDGPH